MFYPLTVGWNSRLMRPVTRHSQDDLMLSLLYHVASVGGTITTVIRYNWDRKAI